MSAVCVWTEVMLRASECRTSKRILCQLLRIEDSHSMHRQLPAPPTVSTVQPSTSYFFSCHWVRNAIRHIDGS